MPYQNTISVANQNVDNNAMIVGFSEYHQNIDGLSKLTIIYVTLGMQC